MGPLKNAQKRKPARTNTKTFRAPSLVQLVARRAPSVKSAGSNHAHVLFIVRAQDFSIYERPAGVASCTGGVAMPEARIELAVCTPGAQRATN